MTGANERPDDELRGAAAALLDLALQWGLHADERAAAVMRHVERLTDDADGFRWWKEHEAELPPDPYHRRVVNERTSPMLRKAALVASLARARLPQNAPYGPPECQIAVNLPRPTALQLDHISQVRRTSKRHVLEDAVGALPDNADERNRLLQAVGALLTGDVPRVQVRLRVGRACRNRLDTLGRQEPRLSMVELVTLAVSLDAIRRD